MFFKKNTTIKLKYQATLLSMLFLVLNSNKCVSDDMYKDTIRTNHLFDEKVISTDKGNLSTDDYNQISTNGGLTAASVYAHMSKVDETLTSLASINKQHTRNAAFRIMLHDVSKPLYDVVTDQELNTFKRLLSVNEIQDILKTLNLLAPELSGRPAGIHVKTIAPILQK